MGVTEELLELDPVLQRVFFDDRHFAPLPDHAAIVDIKLYELSELKQRWYRVRDLEVAEALQVRMRECWFSLRRHCEGYHIALPCGHDDKCQHVVEFKHRGRDAVAAFDIDHRARAALWYRYKQRPPPPWVSGAD
jgi:hypothetical protein